MLLEKVVLMRAARRKKFEERWADGAAKVAIQDQVAPRTNPELVPV